MIPALKVGSQAASLQGFPTQGAGRPLVDGWSWGSLGFFNEPDLYDETYAGERIDLGSELDEDIADAD